MKTTFDVVDSVWFAPISGQNIGIVRVNTLLDGEVFFIGCAVGLNRQNDELLVADRGAHFPYEIGLQLFQSIGVPT